MPLLQTVNNILSRQLSTFVQNGHFDRVVGGPYDFRLAQTFRRVNNLLPIGARRLHGRNIRNNELFDLVGGGGIKLEYLIVAPQQCAIE